MGFRIVWTEPALRDLEQLVRFIAADDAKAALRIGNEIVDHVEILMMALQAKPYLQHASFRPDAQLDFKAYPFNIPAVSALESIHFHPDVTFVPSLSTFEPAPTSSGGHTAQRLQF